MNIWTASYFTLTSPACAFASDLRKAGYQAAIVGFNKNCLLFTPIWLILNVSTKALIYPFFYFFNLKLRFLLPGFFHKKINHFFPKFFSFKTVVHFSVNFQSFFFGFKAISVAFSAIFDANSMNLLAVLDETPEMSNGPQGNSFWSIALFGSCFFHTVSDHSSVLHRACFATHYSPPYFSPFDSGVFGKCFCKYGHFILENICCGFF